MPCLALGQPEQNRASVKRGKVCRPYFCSAISHSYCLHRRPFFGGVVLLVTKRQASFFCCSGRRVGLADLAQEKTAGRERSNLAPIYQEMVNRAQTFALNNPDPDLTLGTQSPDNERPRFARLMRGGLITGPPIPPLGFSGKHGSIRPCV